MTLVARYDGTELAPGVGVTNHRFNSSLLQWKDGYLLAYRTGWGGSEIYVTRLDCAFRVVPDSHVCLDLWGEGASLGCEDPRLFLYRGNLHVMFVGVVGPFVGWVSHTNVLYARLNPDTLAVDQLFFPQYAKRQCWEKSWSPFQHGDDLYMIYETHPRHRILRINGDVATDAHEEPNSMLWLGGRPRGGATPVRVGNEFWHVFHDRTDEFVPTYRVGLMTFAAEPPFKPRRFVPEPILTADRTKMRLNWHAAVVYPCGAVVAGSDLVVSMGVQDSWTELHRWSMDDLESRMVSVGV